MHRHQAGDQEALERGHGRQTPTSDVLAVAAVTPEFDLVTAVGDPAELAVVELPEDVAVARASSSASRVNTSAVVKLLIFLSPSDVAWLSVFPAFSTAC